MIKLTSKFPQKFIGNNMKIKTPSALKRFSPYIKRNGHHIAYIIIFFYCCYILFFVYQNLFITYFDQKPIDPNLIQSKKEVVNQTLFDQVITHSEEKVDNSTNSNIPYLDPFQ